MSKSKLIIRFSFISWPSGARSYQEYPEVAETIKTAKRKKGASPIQMIRSSELQATTLLVVMMIMMMNLLANRKRRKKLKIFTPKILSTFYSHLGRTSMLILPGVRLARRRLLPQARTDLDLHGGAGAGHGGVQRP
uniref:Uncharacterized protein n=1 Tax=Oryza brachyantha TaxID=4533 RepID=J3M8C2_ORYBR